MNDNALLFAHTFSKTTKDNIERTNPMLEIFTHLADWLTYSLLNLDKTTKVADAVHFFIEDTSKIFALLTLMIFIVAFLRAGLGAERIRAFLAGRNRYLCYALAAILGAVTPFCSCSSIPLFLGFTAARIPFGITMAFLITSPSVNEAAVAMFAGSLGWGLTLFYIGIGLLSGILGGIFFDAIKAQRYLRWAQPAVGCNCSQFQAEAQAHLGWNGRLRFAIGETKDILKRISLWVLAGIAIGAALHGCIPDGFIARHLGGGAWWSVPLAITIGIPTYANVTSAIPVTAELIRQGLPVGTAFAFMLSTAATSIPEFIMLKKVMTTRLLVLFATYLLVYFTLCGWILNLFY